MLTTLQDAYEGLQINWKSSISMHSTVNSQLTQMRHILRVLSIARHTNASFILFQVNFQNNK